jgi:hypothetical protein
MRGERRVGMEGALAVGCLFARVGLNVPPCSVGAFTARPFRFFASVGRGREQAGTSMGSSGRSGAGTSSVIISFEFPSSVTGLVVDFFAFFCGILAESYGL